MTGQPREERLVSSFATLADTLVTDYDVVDLLQFLVDTCVDVLDVDEAGILLVSPSSVLELVASTSESNRLVETMQLAAEAGPCIDAFTKGKPVLVPDIREGPAAWHDFTRTASEQGFRSVCALPMRLRRDVIGSVNLMSAAVGTLSQPDQRVAQAFADVAAIGILHQRAMHDSTTLNAQLQHALDSRVVIEQAKGLVAQSKNVTMDEAFAVIRDYARGHSMGLGTVTRSLVERTLRI
jgi:GAF domain-containing protein